MTETTASKAKLKKALEELDCAMERARRVRIENEAFLREAMPRIERIRADLRRAGLLRD
jgi:hypothetical protein